MSIFFDIIAVVIIIYMISRGAKRGFAGTLVSFLGYFLSFSLSMFIASTLSQFIFQQFLRKGMIDTLASQLNLSDLTASLQSFLETLPGFISNAISTQGISADSFSGSVQNVAVSFVDTAVAPVVSGLIRSVLFFILFAICLFLVRRLRRSMRVLNRIPLVGPLNYFLGGILGFIQGIIVLIVIALLATVILWFIPTEMTNGIYTAIEQSYLVKYLFFLL